MWWHNNICMVCFSSNTRPAPSIPHPRQFLHRRKNVGISINTQQLCNCATPFPLTLRRLTSIFEEQPEQILGTSRLISPEKGAPSVVVSDLFCLVADLCSRVASLEKLVHQIQSSAQGEDDACGDNNSGISSVSDDFPYGQTEGGPTQKNASEQRKDPLDDQRKVGKRSLRHFFRLRLTRGSPATRSRVEV